MKLLSKILYYFVLVLLALVALVIIISTFPVTGNYEIKVVKSGSMEPMIMTGSVVIVKPATDYDVNDVVTFEGGFRDESNRPVPVTHRIIEERVEGSRTFFKTKGDANDDPDVKEITRGNILGKVFFTVPYVGYVVETARKPYGFMALIIIPALIIIYDQIVKIVAEVKRMKGRKSQESQDVA